MTAPEAGESSAESDPPQRLGPKGRLALAVLVVVPLLPVLWGVIRLLLDAV